MSKSLNPRRTQHPKSDPRAIDDDSAPKHNNLYSPRGSALEQTDVVISDEPTGVEKYHHGQQEPLKQVLSSASDYSRRESARPYGDEYADVSRMIASTLSSAQVSAGNGLVSENSTLSVDAVLPHVTSVGTLTNLTVSGPSSLSALTVSGSATFSGTVTVPVPVSGTNPVTKDYSDAQVVIAGTGLTKTGNSLAVDAALGHVTSLGNLTGLTVTGDSTFSGAVNVPAPTAGTHAVSKDYSDGQVVIAGTGLTKTGNSLAVDAALGHVTSLGNLTGLTVTGDSTFSGAVNVPAPTVGTHAVSKDYSDGQVVSAGTGLTKTGNVIALDAASITTVGTLTGVTISGAIVTPMQYVAPAEGETVTATGNSVGIILNPAGPLAALTLDFPTGAVNGQRFSVHTTQDITALTVTGTFANGNAPGAGITAGAPLRYIYSTDVGAWLVL